eukprot:11227844-Lingulodinium_polyedra.AAC.1
MEPGMRGPGAGPVATHILRCRGAPEVLRILQVAAEGGDAAAPEVWGPEEWREAVALYLKMGAMPAIYAEAAKTGRHL